MWLVCPRGNELATCHTLRHHKVLLILLSRIDGDAPRAQNDKRRTFGWFESRFVSTFEAALNREHPNLILRTQPFAEAKSDSQLLFIPKKEKVSR
jgi:hypothetical protein